MVCVFHSAFVGLALAGLRNRFWLGVTRAMAAHWLGNFPIFLMGWNVGGLGPTFWGIFVQIWIIAYFVGALGSRRDSLRTLPALSPLAFHENVSLVFAD